ncbi:hypothetical protein [Bifidobacterium callitrichos]|uniref:Uncharacterized protein n=1 Tax=Bifidobacterium callitrichos DSM 23973 TaxID=1437609 RepID=A0A086ZTM4_9BIFI|nr:hypothetical protein [Bifidobacterium callitrichos]KFI49874.1 hypothetical protein BCAL_2389 [Bifidobacterium callitrichos DSM 23973]
MVVSDATSPPPPLARDRPTHVQSALGVGDDVHLPAPGLVDDPADARGELPTGILDRSRRLMASVIYGRTIAFQFAGDASPVVEHLRVAEEDTVHQQDRISSGAHTIGRAGGVEPFLVALEPDLLTACADDQPQRDEVRDGYPPADDADDPDLQPQLDAGQIDGDDADPEDDRFHDDHGQHDGGPRRPVVRHHRERRGNQPDGRDQRRPPEDPQQPDSDVQRPQSAGHPK